MGSNRACRAVSHSSRRAICCDHGNSAAASGTTYGAITALDPRTGRGVGDCPLTGEDSESTAAASSVGADRIGFIAEGRRRSGGDGRGSTGARQRYQCRAIPPNSGSHRGYGNTKTPQAP